jgi:demethylspheroidene O-methyltransferase
MRLDVTAVSAGPPAQHAGAPAPVRSRSSLLDALRGTRDRLVADPRFQRAAAAFPLTRPIARSRSRALFDLCAGFVYSQVLHACVALRLFERLADHPRDLRDLAEATDVPPARLERLLDAATALGLLQSRSGGRIGLGPLGAALLGNPGAIAMIEHHALLYADLADPVALLRQSHPRTELAQFWAYGVESKPGALGADRVGAYTRLMSASQQFLADIVLAAYPFGRHRRLLDIGGGDGTFALAAAARLDHLRVDVFDLPPVARLAQTRFDAAGIGDRATAWGGDFFLDPLPVDADLVTLLRVLHDHDDEHVEALLAAARRAVRPGGALLIAEPVAGSAGAGAGSDCYFGVYLLAMGSGHPRTRAQLSDFTQRAGFHRVRWHRTRNPLFASVMTARPRAR